MAVPVGVDLAEPYIELSYVDAVRQRQRRPLLDCVTARQDLALRHQVPRRLVRLALDTMQPPPRGVERCHSHLDSDLIEPIQTMLDEGLRPKQIWLNLMDDHDVSVSTRCSTTSFATGSPAVTRRNGSPHPIRTIDNLFA